jgi:hypothetical protein
MHVWLGPLCGHTETKHGCPSYRQSMRERALILVVVIVATASAPVQAHAARARIYISDACGDEAYKPSWIPFDCPGADYPDVSSEPVVYRTYGGNVAVARARFKICGGACSSANTPAEEMKRYYRGTLRFSHIVRCDGIKGRARGTRLFYGVTRYSYGGQPWVTLSTNLLARPANYRCPHIRGLST